MRHSNKDRSYSSSSWWGGYQFSASSYVGDDVVLSTTHFSYQKFGLDTSMPDGGGLYISES